MEITGCGQQKLSINSSFLLSLSICMYLFYRISNIHFSSFVSPQDYFLAEISEESHKWKNISKTGVNRRLVENIHPQSDRNAFQFLRYFTTSEICESAVLIIIY